MSRSLAPMAAWNAATWMAGALYGLIVSAVLVRSVGWEGFGIWATIASLRSFLVFLDGGLAIGVARDAALAGEGDAAAASRLRAAYRVYGLLALVAVLISGLGAGLIGLLFGLGGEALANATLVTRLVGLEAGVALAAGVLPAILRGRQRFDALGLITICQTLLGLALLPFMLERWGLVGAAGAALVARVSVTILGFVWMRRRELLSFPQASAQVESLPMPGLLRFATPLWIAAIGAQLGLMTDVPIVAGFYGEEDSGAFAVGARLPAAGAALLFAILASSFPRLVTAGAAKRLRMGSSLLCMGCILAGAGFGYMLLHAETLLAMIFGSAPSLAVQVLWIYAIAWACNAPAHVLSSMAIALGRHRVLAKIVLIEAASNLILSLALALWVSAQGPALATLITLFISNILILPPILRRRLDMSWSAMTKPVLCGFLFGAVAAGSATSFASLLDGSDLTRAIIALILTLAIAGAFLDLTSRGSSSLRRIMLVTWRRGWPVLRRQARQIESEGKRLRELRKTEPIRWQEDSQPLVTVRIATYNRGP
ncbi:MAG: MATE family efflux transporter, partial [Planctomycetota bacterium]